ncbi:MAG: tetratricopeptide repeat protein [Chromatiaceae bacterium]|nr:tetratricopeptide repeat protein [Chromatiaceae bacterium]
MIRLLAFISLSFFAAATPLAAEPTDCEPLKLSKKGPPFDYNDPSDLARERLRLAEGAHFTQSVRSGTSGNAGSLIGDLDFVLRVFPNHPYALSVMADVQQRPGFSRQHPLRKDKYYPTLNCYFQRALQVAPNDAAVYLVMAIHQHKLKRFQQAKGHYERAIRLKPDAAEAHYNLGLLLVSTGELEQALEHAHTAYNLGYPLPGLKEKLRSRGVWREPVAPEPEPEQPLADVGL